MDGIIINESFTTIFVKGERGGPSRKVRPIDTGVNKLETRLGGRLEDTGFGEIINVE
jgi:hypothetical protein